MNVLFKFLSLMAAGHQELHAEKGTGNYSYLYYFKQTIEFTVLQQVNTQLAIF